MLLIAGEINGANCATTALRGRLRCQLRTSSSRQRVKVRTTKQSVRNTKEAHPTKFGVDIDLNEHQPIMFSLRNASIEHEEFPN